MYRCAKVFHFKVPNLADTWQYNARNGPFHLELAADGALSLGLSRLNVGEEWKSRSTLHYAPSAAVKVPETCWIVAT